MTDTSWRLLFAAAALFNFGAGIPALLAPASVLAALGIAPLPHDLFVRTTGWMIVLFGIGYWLVSRDLSRRELVWLGALGKAGAFLLFAWAWGRGMLPLLPFALGVGDLLFAGAFVVFLRTPSRRAASSPAPR